MRLDGYRIKVFARQSIAVCFCIVLLLLGSSSSYGADREEAIKAAYLFNFAKYTYWADLPREAPLHVQIVGQHPFGKSLAPLLSKTVGHHPLKITAFADFSPESPVQILFIAKNMKAVVPDILQAVKDRPILTISDIEGFTEMGGMIGLIGKDNLIRFTVNLDAALQAGIELNSQMVRLAESVISTSTESE